MRSIILYAAVSSALLLSGCSDTGGGDTTTQSSASNLRDSGGIIVSPNDTREYAHLTLENGLTVLMVSDATIEKSAVALAVDVGSFENPKEFQGLAHYLEHMLFLGSEKYPQPGEYAQFVSGNGGSWNAYTSFEITNYMATVNNTVYPELLDRFSDFFKSPLLDPEYSDKERNAVHAEWKRNYDNDSRSEFHLTGSLMGDHPMNTLTVGNLDTLQDREEQTLHDAMTKFYANFYSADRMKAVMISDRPIAEVKELAKTYFGDVPKRETSSTETTAVLDFTQSAGKHIKIVPTKDLKQLKLDFFIDAVEDDNGNDPTGYISYILGSEMAGSPASFFKEKGWANGVNSYSSPTIFGNYGYFNVEVDLTDEGMKHREEMVEVIQDYIELIRTQGLTDKYEQEYRTARQNAFRFLEKVGDFRYASTLAANMLEYSVEHVIYAPYRFEGFDRAATEKVLAQLVPERMNVIYKSKNEEVDQQIEFYAQSYSLTQWMSEDTGNLVSKYKLELPANNQLLPDGFDLKGLSSELKVMDVNGVNFWLAGSEEFKTQPKGLMRINFNNEFATQSAKDAVLETLWIDIFNMEQASLLNEARIGSLNIRTFANNGVHLQLFGFTDKQDEALERVMANIRLNAPEKFFGAALERYVRQLNNASYDSTFNQGFSEFSKLIAQGTHSDKRLLSAASEVTVDDLSQFIERTLTQSRALAFMLGNYDTEDVTRTSDLLAQYLKPVVGERITTKFWKPTQADFFLRNKVVPVENTTVVWAFASQDAGPKDQAIANVLGAHFRIATFNQLRTEEQWGYAVGASATSIDEHGALFLVVQTPKAGPDKMVERMSSFRAEYLEKLSAMSDEEFEQLKSGALTRLTQPPKNLSEEASPALSDWVKNNPELDTKAKLIAATEQVTKADLVELYQRLVLSDDAPQVLIQIKGTDHPEAGFAAPEGGQEVKDIDAHQQAMPLQ